MLVVPEQFLTTQKYILEGMTRNLTESKYMNQKNHLPTSAPNYGLHYIIPSIILFLHIQTAFSPLSSIRLLNLHL